MMMLDQLLTLATAIDEGSLESAARKLLITPSAVSQRIKAMEQQAGQVLMLRTRPLLPTDAGLAYVRLARQVAQLSAEAMREIDATHDSLIVPLAVNADSMATWLLQALAPLAAQHHVVFDLHRDDEEHSANLLRSGTTMAAITARVEPVQGCRVTRLGRMRYRAFAHRTIAATYFAGGVSSAALAEAPVVSFDRKDDLQYRYIKRFTRRAIAPPTHYIPASHDFARAIEIGLGWGMLPQDQASHPELVDLTPNVTVDVTLYWQRWKIDSRILDLVTDAVGSAARAALH
ncbi:MAG: LysR family transcriptional regulator ArgP [Antricoccus sp.]